MSTQPQDSPSSTVPSGGSQSESAKAAKRTWAFVALAVGCLLVTGLFEWMSRPAKINEYGKIGQEFYPEFTDPTTATSLTVSVIDPEEVKPLEFSIKQADNGQWVIPSHHNYPADAADQLAQTASSVIGIKRGAMVTRWPTDHSRYGVVDPQTDSIGIDELEGIGKRITFGDKDDTVLASYIIGNKIEDSNNQYYVRHPGEDETYIAELDINLTTRFRDWVNTDLLDFTAADVLRIELNDYSFDEIQGTVTGSVESDVSRDSATDDWKLAGIDEATQEVNADAIQETVDALTNLEIAGVRPKQPGLTADLRIDREALTSQRDADQLTRDLLARGFLLQPSADDKDRLELIAREGEMFVGTQDGLLYRLYFGRVFTGSEEELEIGLSGEGGDEAEKAESGDAADEVVEIEETKESGKPGRYVFVRVNFDPSLLGDQLTEPTEPVEPEELATLEEKVRQAAASKDNADASADVEATEVEADSDEESEADQESTEESETAEPEETDAQKLQRLRLEFESAKIQYQSDVTAFKAYQQKLKEGETKSEDLNRRFALWYYVIPGESYDKLALKASDLVKDKETEEAAEVKASDNALPTIGGLSDAVIKGADSPAAEGNAAPENAADESTESEKSDKATEQPEAAEPSGDGNEQPKEPEPAEPQDEPDSDGPEEDGPAEDSPADSEPEPEPVPEASEPDAEVDSDE